ncbi:MAG TPA: aminotransferase class V-fold PLP-dependent enzyme [Gaiellaceae bacterium]|nr:aminotransferase class V-fold PLP-dependent enzyme [Gaiellaceae bacterium]
MDGRPRDDTLDLLDLVAAEARRYFPALDDDVVRSDDADDAARSLVMPLPEEGIGSVQAVAQLIETARDAHIRSAGPRFFHWVFGGATPAALGADWLTSLLDQNAGGWDASPLATQLERTSIDWLKDLFALPAEWGGIITTGATMANFTALAAARQWAGEGDVYRDGLRRPIPVFSSGFIHVSARKALGMLGLGKDAVRICAADAAGHLDLAALERGLAETDGPAIVVANCGEVNAGHFDPIDEMVDVAREHGAWVHVDGAFGLFARLSPRFEHLAAGVERADSVIADGHKWLNVPFDCGFAFVRDEPLLAAAFSVAEAAYLPDIREDRPTYAYLGPEMSRRARSLPVWATLAAYGRDGHRAIVEANIAHAERVAALVEVSNEFELLADAPLNVVCFRYRPEGVPEDQLDDLNLRLGEDVIEDGRIYVGTTRWEGRVGFRPAFCNWRTRDEDVDLLLTVLSELGARQTAQV